MARTSKPDSSKKTPPAGQARMPGNARKAAPSRRNFYRLLGLVAAAMGIFIVYQVTKPAGSSAPRIDTSAPLPEATGYLMGNPAAPVQVIEFADFECPACANFFALTEPDVRKLVEAGTISYRFMDYPLPGHANTWPASNAAACANEQGKFWQMHDALFEGQDQWNGQATRRPKGVFEGYARRIGLDVGRWEDCFDQAKYQLNVQAHARDGERRLVSQTPTFIIGNKVLPGSISYDKFKAYVDSAMATAPTPPADSAPARGK